MKSFLQIFLAVACFGIGATTFAGNQAGDDSARHYRLNPEAFEGKRIDIDVAYVRPILRTEDRIEGIEFFIAHTVDDDNHARGGSMLVAVMDSDVKSFTRKYGTAIDRSGRSVDTTRLRGTFHFFEKGHRVYLDESGEAHELILAHIETNSNFQLPAADSPRGKSGIRSSL